MIGLHYFVLFLFFTASIFAFSIPVNLHCDWWTNQQGIDVPNPVLSWTIQTDANTRGMHQIAYQVLVALSLEKLEKDDGDLWNSGKVQSSPRWRAPNAIKLRILQDEYSMGL